MADPKKRKLREWQMRALRRLDDILRYPDFKSEAASIKGLSDEQRGIRVVKLMLKYKAPANSYGYIKHFIETDNKDNSLIPSTVQVASELEWTLGPYGDRVDQMQLFDEWHKGRRNNLVEQPGVFLVLNPEATAKEVKQFVDEFWKTDVEPQLRKLDNRGMRVIRSQGNIVRNSQIWALDQQGKTPKEIIAILDLSVDSNEVRRIIRREQKKRAT